MAHCSLEYEAYRNNSSLPEPLGCPKDVFDWCESTGTINFWIYVVMMVLLLGIFWPFVNISLSTILSRVLGPRRQANQQSMVGLLCCVYKNFSVSNVRQLRSFDRPRLYEVFVFEVVSPFLSATSIQ